MTGGSSFNQAARLWVSQPRGGGHLSRSVSRDCSLSVPVCPTVPALGLTRETSDREVGRAPLLKKAEMIRPSLPLVLWCTRSCFEASRAIELRTRQQDAVFKGLKRGYHSTGTLSICSHQDMEKTRTTMR